MTVLGLERFKPNVDPPPDFLRFWALAVAELQAIAPRPIVTRETELDAGATLYDVTYVSLGGAEITGYLLRPATVQPRPLIVHAHGYNDRFEVMVEWARLGFNVFGFDARGFGRSVACAPPSPDGYVLTGIETPDTSILRGAVADYLQAATSAKTLLEGIYSTVHFYGFSFGGALALMAAALSRDPDLVVLGQPTFAWHAERRRLALAGSARQVNDYLERHPWRSDAVMHTLRFFDTLHFAPLIKTRALIGIGLDDDVVPSRTVLAAANHIAGPVEVRLLPVSHSADPRESLWRDFHAEWLGYVRDGLPSDFGMQNRQVKALVA